MAYQTRLSIATLAKANQDLQKADRRKSEFLAMLAHELRNPLASFAWLRTGRLVSVRYRQNRVTLKVVSAKLRSGAELVRRAAHL
jgi:signal transduction histidine kinase